MTTAIFLYIAILLPAIAFGSLNDESTRGEIGQNMPLTGNMADVFYSASLFRSLFSAFYYFSLCLLLSSFSFLFHVSLNSSCECFKSFTLSQLLFRTFFFGMYLFPQFLCYFKNSIFKCSALSGH